MLKKVWDKIKAFCAFIWAHIKGFFAAIADFFKDEEKRFSSGRLIKIAAGFLAGFLVFAAVFTTWIPVDRLALLLPYIEKAVLALLVFSGVVQISQNVTKQ
jgi:fructose-specific phosphotransferase system IIC component